MFSICASVRLPGTTTSGIDRRPTSLPVRKAIRLKHSSSGAAAPDDQQVDRGIGLDPRQNFLADVAFAKDQLGGRPDEFADLRRSRLEEDFRLDAPLFLSGAEVLAGSAYDNIVEFVQLAERHGYAEIA